MIPNKMQQEVLSSDKRFVVITAQPGSGSTTALILKLAQEVGRTDKKIGVYLRRTSPQILYTIRSFLKEIPGSRWSSKSNILTFKYLDKKVKIKMLSLDTLDIGVYIPCIAIDMGSHFDDLNDVFSTSGKIVICDFASQVRLKDSWAYRSGLIDDLDGTIIWKPFVDHIVGYNNQNPGLSQGYIDAVQNLPPEHYKLFMSVEI